MESADLCSQMIGCPSLNCKTHKKMKEKYPNPNEALLTKEDVKSFRDAVGHYVDYESTKLLRYIQQKKKSYIQVKDKIEKNKGMRCDDILLELEHLSLSKTHYLIKKRLMKLDIYCLKQGLKKDSIQLLPHATDGSN